MFITCWTINHGNNVLEDHYDLHETEMQAVKNYNHLLETEDRLLCAAVSEVKTALDPHWMEIDQ